MKNTLFFDETFSPVLLRNEEADAEGMRNAIFLHFTTSSATPQKLQITVRGQLNEIPLNPETEYNFQLLGEYWSSGATTSIRLVSGGSVSEYTYIEFPEIIQVDAALQEQDADNNEYYFQGKQDQADELKTTMLVYKNGGEYNVTNLAKIAEFFFLSKNDGAGALLTLTATIFCTGISTTAELEFRFRTNSVFDDVFKPIETVENRAYIVTLTYPVENISSNVNNHTEIYLKINEGNAQILQGGAIATLTASGIVNGAPDPWDGNLDIVERIQPLALTYSALSIVPLSEDFSAETQRPQAEVFTERISLINIGTQNLSVVGVYDNVIVGRRTLSITVEPDRAAEYTFNANYINVATTFALRLDYDYISEPGSIDSGYIESVDLPLNTFSSLVSLNITEVTT